MDKDVLQWCQIIAAAGLGLAIGRYLFSDENVSQEKRKIINDATNNAAKNSDLQTSDGVHDVVRAAYGARVEVASDVGCCSGGTTSRDVGAKLGYDLNELDEISDANLGEGCGNPLSFAKMQAGETIVDLGSGAGIDCLLAGKKVGKEGKVIGVDMTAEMISKAREIVREKKVSNVEYRLGEIEHLPIPDNFVDAVISNCVINLSPDQKQVYSDIFRVLKPGGRIAIADVVQKAALPQHLKTAEALACWVSGAKAPEQIDALLASAGFVEIDIKLKPESREVIKNWVPNSGAEDYVVSADITARKPTTATTAQLPHSQPQPRATEKKNSTW